MHRLCLLVPLLLCVASADCPTTKRFRNPFTEVTANGDPFPHTLLYSFEGSGNTWTRWLIENATGVYTHS